MDSTGLWPSISLAAGEFDCPPSPFLEKILIHGLKTMPLRLVALEAL